MATQTSAPGDGASSPSRMGPRFSLDDPAQSGTGSGGCGCGGINTARPEWRGLRMQMSSSRTDPTNHCSIGSDGSEAGRGRAKWIEMSAKLD